MHWWLWKILILIQRIIIQIQIFLAIEAYQFFKERMKKIWILNHLVQREMSIETLTEKIVTVALKETEFEYDESEQH